MNYYEQSKENLLAEYTRLKTQYEGFLARSLSLDLVKKNILGDWVVIVKNEIQPFSVNIRFGILDRAVVVIHGKFEEFFLGDLHQLIVNESSGLEDIEFIERNQRFQSVKHLDKPLIEVADYHIGVLIHPRCHRHPPR